MQFGVEFQGTVELIRINDSAWRTEESLMATTEVNENREIWSAELSKLTKTAVE